MTRFDVGNDLKPIIKSLKIKKNGRWRKKKIYELKKIKRQMRTIKNDRWEQWHSHDSEWAQSLKRRTKFNEWNLCWFECSRQSMRNKEYFKIFKWIPFNWLHTSLNGFDFFGFQRLDNLVLIWNNSIFIHSYVSLAIDSIYAVHQRAAIYIQIYKSAFYWWSLCGSWQLMAVYLWKWTDSIEIKIRIDIHIKMLCLPANNVKT